MFQECDACVSSENRESVKNILLAHLNSAFNNEVQEDFLTLTIGSKRLEILNAMDIDKKFGERTVARKQDATTMTALFDSKCIYRNGALSSFSAGPETYRPSFRSFLRGHGITFDGGPS